MEYKDIEAKYIKADIKGCYKFQNAAEVIAVLGYDIRKIKGFKQLSEEDQRLAEYLICKYISGFGLQAREELPPLISVIREQSRFKVTFQNKKYSYLYDTGTVG